MGALAGARFNAVRFGGRQHSEVFGMLRRFVLLTALAAGIIAVCAVPAMAKEFRVDDSLSADCPNADFTTIQAAVNAAGPGDHIKVCPGTYTEHVVIARARQAEARIDEEASGARSVPDDATDGGKSRRDHPGAAVRRTSGSKASRSRARGMTRRLRVAHSPRITACESMAMATPRSRRTTSRRSRTWWSPLEGARTASPSAWGSTSRGRPAAPTSCTTRSTPTRRTG